MEFYHSGTQKTTHVTSTRHADEFNVEPEPESLIQTDINQKSWIHIWGTVYVARKFLESKGIKINEKWEKCPEWVNDYIKVTEYIEQSCASGILESRAADTLGPILEWLRTKDWSLDGIEQLTVAPNSVLVAIHFYLKYGSPDIQDEFRMTTNEQKFNGHSMRALNIDNAITATDKFGNISGFYRYDDACKGITTIRLTRLEHGDSEEVMLNHLTDEGMKVDKLKYKG